MGLRLGERKRARKRGKAEPIRCYNHHIAMRLTYYEAEVLHKVLSGRAVSGEVLGDQESRALGRICRKARLAAEADQDVVRKANMVKQLAKLRARVKAQEDSGIKPDWEDTGTIDYLEGRLACEDFLQSGAVRERVR